MVEISKVLVEVESVADDKLVRDGKASVVGKEPVGSLCSLEEKRDDLDRGGLCLSLDLLGEGSHGEARVDDVLDEEDLLSGQVLEVDPRDADVSSRLGPLVRLDPDKVERKMHRLGLVGVELVQRLDLVQQVVVELVRSFQDAHLRSKPSEARI